MTSTAAVTTSETTTISNGTLTEEYAETETTKLPITVLSIDELFDAVMDDLSADALRNSIFTFSLLLILLQ